jgi:predicted dehydrogenase
MAISQRRIGVGFIGTQHAHAAGKLEAARSLAHEFQVVGIVEPDINQRQLLAGHPKFRGVRWLSESELLNLPTVEAVIIETAVPDLVPAAQRAIEASKHVHLEKPGGISRATFCHLFESALARKRHIQMGYMLRSNPAFEFCFRVVREGLLGRIFEVSGAMGKLADDKVRREIAAVGGGAMFELGCHLIDAAITILGPPTNVKSFNRATQSDGVPDNQLAVLEYADALATIRASIVEPFGSERRHFEVTGEKGTIEIRPLEPPSLELTLNKPTETFLAGQQTIKLSKSKGRYQGELREFARIIRGGTPQTWSAEHDLAVHLTVLQASGLPTKS